MTLDIVAETDMVTLWYHPEEKIVHHQIHKYAYGEEFRRVLVLGVETLKKNGACKWLSDDRSHKAIPKEDIDWGRNEWTGMAIKAGWKYWAIVPPTSAVGKMSYERMIEEYRSLGVDVSVFDDAEQAMEWLKSVH